MNIYELPAEVSEGFWSFKGHYFGSLQIKPSSVAFNGYRRSFTLKKIPLSIEINIETISSISLQNSRLVKVNTKDGQRHIFMIGQGSTNEYGSQNAGYMASQTVAGNLGGDVYNIERSKNNEKLLGELLAVLKNSEYAGLLENENIEGTKVSSLFKASMVTEIVIRVVVALIIFVALFFAIKQAFSLLI